MRAPSRVLVCGAAQAAAAFSRRRRRALGPGYAAQDRALASLIEGYSRCVDGVSFGLQRGMSAKEYRQRVPLRTYEGFAPLVTRMLKGEADVLWPGSCDHFAVSSGTTAGRTKHLPVNREMIAHFRRTGLESLLLASEHCGNGLFAGRSLFLGGATALERLSRPTGVREGFAGDLSGITALRMPRWADRFLYEPGSEIARMSDWPRKIAAVAERCLDRDITLLAGIPSWILVLAEELRRRASQRGRSAASLSELWPGLRCLVHGGVPIAPYLTELRAVLGAGVGFHEVYPASEGFVAAQDGESGAGMRLFCDAGIHYEFLPLHAYDESRLAELGPKTLPLEGVEAGVDYVLIMSTPAGLSRYVIGDVVRFVSTEVPRLVYSGRTRLQLSAFGEHVIERELTECIASCVSNRGIQVANFHVAPVFVDLAAGVSRGRHEWWVAIRGDAARQLDPTLLAVELDAELSHRNDDYAAKRAGGGLDLPVVRLVPPSVFEDWQKSVGKWGGQNKMPRCRSDREVADGLHHHSVAAVQAL